MFMAEFVIEHTTIIMIPLIRVSYVESVVSTVSTCSVFFKRVRVTMRAKIIAMAKYSIV
jgi:hypothetical protein